jgi:DNA excision repair protein ERCC-2
MPALVAPVSPSADEASAPDYTVSVRSLCEFTAKRGDLDRRFTPSATALEGQHLQAAVQARRGADYEAELPLQACIEGLRVRGRADGYSPQQQRLEEIKTIRGSPEAIPDNRRQLHWAQLQTYGALLCVQRQLQAVELALVYVDAATQQETVLLQQACAADLQALLLGRCQQYRAWAQQEARHRRARDAALQALPFPAGTFRPGQRAMAEAVYRSAANQRCLLVQAPTGIGKTLGALFPMLRAMPSQGLDKVAYLTCKGTGRTTALDALRSLGPTHLASVREDGGAPGALRVLAVVAKEQACEHPGKACHPQACPLASGFYDRLPAARQAAVTTAWLDPAAQRRIALQHAICPYYLGQELLRWADVLVGDVHHAFDPSGSLHSLALALGWRLGLLVDEAHNLVDRTRQMYSAALDTATVHAAAQLAPAGLRPLFGALLQALQSTALAQGADYAAHADVPETVADALQALVSGLGDHVQAQPLATGPLLNFYFDMVRLQKAVDRFGAHSLLDVQRGPAAQPLAAAARPYEGAAARAVESAEVAQQPRPNTRQPESMSYASVHDQLEVGLEDAVSAETGDLFAGELLPVTLSIRCIAPAPFLRPRFEAWYTAVLFSATLAPERYQRDLLGLPESTAWLDVPPAFPPENLQVQVAHHLSTRFPHRADSLVPVVDLVAQQFHAHPGNYLAFFSSFQYLQQAALALAQRHPLVPQWRQVRSMDDAERQAFLARFVPEGQGVAFAVLGGAFAEGVDLPGRRLVGAFIATLGLPPVSPLQDQVRMRLDALFGPGHGYADLVPGLQKVVQAAGRVLRTPEDRGWLWLLDGRYNRPDVVALLPATWRLRQQRPSPSKVQR